MIVGWSATMVPPPRSTIGVASGGHYDVDRACKRCRVAWRSGHNRSEGVRARRGDSHRRRADAADGSGRQRASSLVGEQLHAGDREGVPYPRVRRVHLGDLAAARCKRLVDCVCERGSAREDGEELRDLRQAVTVVAGERDDNDEER